MASVFVIAARPAGIKVEANGLGHFSALLG
jgi:hypothetical protein